MSILQAISDIGLLRNINEDYAFCSSHPKNPIVKLMVLADGMGGKSQGDVASQEVVADIEAWFYHEDVGILSEIDGVEEVIANYNEGTVIIKTSQEIEKNII